MTATQSLLAAPARRNISLTALIDVVFILLMFFMLTASFNQYAESTLNTPTEGKNPISDSVQILRLSATHTISIAGATEYASLNLEEALSALDPDVPIILLPHSNVDLQTILSDFEMLKASGATHLTLGEAWGGDGA